MKLLSLFGINKFNIIRQIFVYMWVYIFFFIFILKVFWKCARKLFWYTSKKQKNKTIHVKTILLVKAGKTVLWIQWMISYYDACVDIISLECLCLCVFFEMLKGHKKKPYPKMNENDADGNGWYSHVFYYLAFRLFWTWFTF